MRPKSKALSRRFPERPTRLPMRRMQVRKSFRKLPRWFVRLDMTTACVSINPSSVASNITLALFSKLISPSKSKTTKAGPVRFGSVGGGGRYDGLVSRFMGQPVPATGFSIGVSRLQAALTMLGKLGEKPAAGPGCGHRVRPRPHGRLPEAWSPPCATPNIRAELYLGNPKNNLGSQLKYADKRGSPCAIIQGGDEKAQGEVQIKDLILGASPPPSRIATNT